MKSLEHEFHDQFYCRCRENLPVGMSYNDLTVIRFNLPGAFVFHGREELRARCRR